MESYTRLNERGSLTDDEYRTLEPDVKTAARTTAREWAAVTTADDAEQDIWVRLLESPGSVDTLTEMDQPGRVKALTNIGRQIASGQRDDFGYFSGNYHYSSDEVREILDNGALESERIQSDHTAAMQNIWEYDWEIIKQFERTDTETATQRIDLALGLQGLRDAKSPYFAVIVNKFVHELDPDHRKTLTRAIDSLTDEMNRVNTRRKFNYEGVGGRRSMGNSTAQEVTGSEYDG